MSAFSIGSDELPLPPDAFVDRLMAGIDDYAADHGLDVARFDEAFAEDEMRNGLYSRIYAEVAVAEVTERMLRDCDDGRLTVHLLKQLEDEYKHARLLSKRLRELGGDPSGFEARANDLSVRYFEEVFPPGEDLLETAVKMQGVTERLAGERHPKEKECYDEETAAIYENVIIPDEQFHAQVGVNVIREYATDGNAQRRALSAAESALRRKAEHDQGYQASYRSPT